MFGTNTLSRGLSLGKILNGLSKTLSIANQAIPIYEQVKPMVGNAKKLFSLVKEFKNTPVEKETKPNHHQKTIKKELPSKPQVNSSLPVFFQ